jgi:predicted porin
MAQSSVTLYGLADVWFGSTSVDKGDKNGSLSQTKLDSGGFNTSRWGMKGSEDLGGGLKANFNLESHIYMDTGAGSPDGLLFNRAAWVGLSGGFGALQLGRMTSTVFNVAGASDAMFDGTTFSPVNNIGRVTDTPPAIGGGAKTGNTNRFSNAVSYSIPTMSGFNATIQYALGENKDALGAADSAWGLNATYAAGPVGVQFAYQVESCKVAGRVTGTGTALCAGGTQDREYTFLGGSYDFGAAVLKATYGHTANIAGLNGANSDEYQIGVDVPVSPALILSASYAAADDNSTQSKAVGATGDVSREGYGLGVKYILSKRTFLYGAYESDTETRPGKLDYEHSVFAVGVQHRF